jgi:hypothetical protein
MHLRTAYAWSRIALAAAIVVRPERIGRSWIGPAAADPSAQGALRSVAVRDACLGAAALADRRAVRLGIAADVGDLLVIGGDYVRTRRRGAAVAAGAAVFGLAFGVLVERAGD